MQLYHLIVVLNNKGAVLLQSNLHASLLLFQTALEVCISGQLETELGGHTIIPDMPVSNSTDLIEYLEVDENRFFGTAPVVLQHAFVRPIIMNSSLTAYSQDSFVNLAVAATIITFNQALVFHRLGLADNSFPSAPPEEADASARPAAVPRMTRRISFTGSEVDMECEDEKANSLEESLYDDDSEDDDQDNDSKAVSMEDSATSSSSSELDSTNTRPQAAAHIDSLHKARELYLQVLSSLNNLGISTTRSSGHSIVDLLMLAIVNNLAQIAFLSHEYDLSISLFVKLFVYAASIDIPSFRDRETAFILQWHISFFRHNFSFFPFPLHIQNHHHLLASHIIPIINEDETNYDENDNNNKKEQVKSESTSVNNNNGNRQAPNNIKREEPPSFMSVVG